MGFLYQRSFQGIVALLSSLFVWAKFLFGAALLYFAGGYIISVVAGSSGWAFTQNAARRGFAALWALLTTMGG